MKKAAIVIVSIMAMGLACVPAASQTQDIRTFVRQVYIEGVPFEEVQQFDAATAVPVLLEMLGDPKEEEYWPNVVVTLGMLGDVRAVDPLIQFVEQEVPGTLSHAHYIAKTSAVMSLGYIVSKSNSDKALSYLTAGLDPEVWKKRGIKWSSPYHPNQADLIRQLVTMSVLGLGLSGNPKAAEALRAKLPKDFETLREALEANETIAKIGLTEYYRASRRPIKDTQQGPPNR